MMLRMQWFKIRFKTSIGHYSGNHRSEGAEDYKQICVKWCISALSTSQSIFLISLYPIFLYLMNIHDVLHKLMMTTKMVKWCCSKWSYASNMVCAVAMFMSWSAVILFIALLRSHCEKPLLARHLIFSTDWSSRSRESWPNPVIWILHNLNDFVKKKRYLV